MHKQPRNMNHDRTVWPPPPLLGSNVSDDAISVPLNLPNFRRYRDTQAATATLGMVMTLGCGGGFIGLSLYGALVDVTHRQTWLGIALFSLLLPLVIGSATWPALQLAKTLTDVLKRNLPALIINREGIWDYSSNYVFGLIPWSEIDKVMLSSRHSTKLDRDFFGIALVTKTSGSLLRRKPGLLGAWMSMEAEITDRRQIFIPEGRIEAQIHDLVKQVNAFRTQRMTEQPYARP